MRLPEGRRLNTPQAEFGPNDHREDAPHFIGVVKLKELFQEEQI